MMEYPLAWPVGMHRKPSPERSRFETSESAARNGLLSELALMRATEVVITSNLEIKPNGYPYANQRVTDSGVAVYFKRKGLEQCIACDKWDSIRDNLQAIRKTIEALRGIERWGTGEMVDAAFRGFTALPATASINTMVMDQPWYDVLHVSPNAPRAFIDAAYKAALKTAHPDTGGSQAEFERVQKAYREAQS